MKNCKWGGGKQLFQLTKSGMSCGKFLNWRTLAVNQENNRMWIKLFLSSNTEVAY